MRITAGAPAPRFPMFVDLSEKRVIVFGGGMVALRRARTIADFCRNIVVVSPEICKELQNMGVHILPRPYCPGDCTGFGLVLAATDSRKTNHEIFLEARQQGIPVNVCDAPEECDFFFPAVVRRGHVVIGVTASGTDHTLAKETAGRLRENLDLILPGKERGDDET